MEVQKIEDIRREVQSVLGDRLDREPPKGGSRGSALRKESALEKKFALYFDHTLLRVDATTEDFRTLFDEAASNGFYSVCIPPRVVPTAVRVLAGTNVKVCTVIGFPAGYTTTDAKVQETRICLQEGADEFDMVLPIGEVRDRNLPAVYDDVRAVVAAAPGRAVKVILETCYLADEEKVAAGITSILAGAAFLKTSTGFGPAGATIADVGLLRLVAGENVGVKAAGGIRDRKAAEAFVAAGADRIGSSSSVKIVGGQ